MSTPSVNFKFHRRPETNTPARILLAQVPGRIEQRQIFAEPHIGAVADDERQVREALVAHGVERRAVGGDDMHLAIRLPQGGGLALLDLDQQAVGIEFGDRDLLDERKLLAASRARSRHRGRAANCAVRSRPRKEFRHSLNSLWPAIVTALMPSPRARARMSAGSPFSATRAS